MWALVVSDKPRLTAHLRVRLHTPASIVHLGLKSGTTNTLEAEITTNLVECDNQDRPPWALVGQRLLNGEPLYPPEGADESSSEESEEEGVACRLNILHDPGIHLGNTGRSATSFQHLLSSIVFRNFGRDYCYRVLGFVNVTCYKGTTYSVHFGS